MMRTPLLFGIALGATALIFPALADALNLNLQYPVFGDFNLNDNQDLATLIPWIYNGLIGLSGLAAFVMLVRAGVLWMTSSVNPAGIGEAKSMMQSAVLGILLVLTSYIILQVINPELLTPTLPNISKTSSTSASPGTKSEQEQIPGGYARIIIEKSFQEGASNSTSGVLHAQTQSEGKTEQIGVLRCDSSCAEQKRTVLPLGTKIHVVYEGSSSARTIILKEWDAQCGEGSFADPGSGVCVIELTEHTIVRAVLIPSE